MVPGVEQGVDRQRRAAGAAGGVGGALAVSGATVTLSNGTLLTSNSAPAHASVSLASGAVVYALPAPLGHWIASSFLCAWYRQPCAAALGSSCDPEAQPLLEHQPCSVLAQQPRLEGAVVSLLPVGGLDVDYPFRCSAGFFGNTLADQTTPQCAGLCPAGHRCASGTTAPQRCEQGGFCAVGSSTATLCPRGSFSHTPGLTSAQQCQICPRGHWCDQGARVACGVNTFNALEGQFEPRSCLLCPLNSRTTADSAVAETECRCDVGFVRTVVNASSGALGCIRCPDGTECTSLGTTLVTLHLKPGYWRHSVNTSAVYRCPDAGSPTTGCIGGSNASTCKPSLAGAYCKACAEPSWYYSSFDSECRVCTVSGMLDSQAMSILVVALLVVLYIAISVGCTVYDRYVGERSTYLKKRLFAAQPRGLASGRSKRISALRRTTTTLQPLVSSSQQCYRWLRAVHDALKAFVQDLYRRASLSCKLRQLISFVQVLAEIQDVLPIAGIQNLRRGGQRCMCLAVPACFSPDVASRR